MVSPTAGPWRRGWQRIFENVAALRTDSQGPPGGPQGEPLQYQDQAPVPAEPVQRHLHFRRARPQRAPAGFDQRDQERRPQWRPRRLPAQGPRRSPLPPRARPEARDREEARCGSAGGEAELRDFALSGVGAESFGWPGRKTRLFLLWGDLAAKS